jgi:hypothetical protein
VAEYQCLFRHHVTPAVAPPPRKRSLNPFAFRPRPLTGIWSVAKDGANAVACIDDARRGIESEALPWFEERRTAEQMLVLLQADWESPMRSYALGFTAARLGDYDVARERLQEAIDSGAFELEAERLQSALDGLPR